MKQPIESIDFKFSSLEKRVYLQAVVNLPTGRWQINHFASIDSDKPLHPSDEGWREKTCGVLTRWLCERVWGKFQMYTVAEMNWAGHERIGD